MLSMRQIRNWVSVHCPADYLVMDWCERRPGLGYQLGIRLDSPRGVGIQIWPNGQVMIGTLGNIDLADDSPAYREGQAFFDRLVTMLRRNAIRPAGRYPLRPGTSPWWA